MKTTPLHSRNTTALIDDGMTTMTPLDAETTTGTSYDETELFIPWSKHKNIQKNAYLLWHGHTKC